MTSDASLTIIIPVFNESPAIEKCLRDLRQAAEQEGISPEILVVDDGSTDDTAKLVEGMPGPVRLLRHGTNRGYGAALKTGLRHASHDVVCIIDGDNTYPPEAIPGLLRQMDRADMVVACRDRPCIPWQRRPAKQLLRILAEYLVGHSIPDLNSGLRLFRKSDARRFLHLFPDGFSFTTTITLAMLTHGYEVRYVPVVYRARDGASKIRPLRDLFGFLALIVRTSVHFNPLRVFVPVGLFLVVMASALSVHAFMSTTRVPVTAIVLLLITALNAFTTGLLADLIAKQARK